MSRPKIVVHAKVKILNSLLQLCEELGFACERRGYSIEEIRTPNEAHLIWGMAFRPDTCHQLAKLGNVFFVENGWFTQRTGCYIDKNGTNAMSSIRGAKLPIQLNDKQTREVSEFISDLHGRVKIKPVCNEKDYILIPLQVERDTQLLFWSGCDSGYPNRQLWFIDQVCQTFPEQKLIIRPHKRDPSVTERLKTKCSSLLHHPNISFRSDGSSYNWIANAKAVVGINSTVLMEALTFYKPVYAMGTGVFTDNGVMLECQGNPNVLTELLDFQPNHKQITKFLHFLIKRQVPYNLKAKDISKYPVFMEMLDCACQKSL